MSRRSSSQTQCSSMCPSHPDHIPIRYFELTKKHFVIVKCLHHLKQLESMPPSLQRKERDLATLLKPAFTSQGFREASGSLAHRWAEDARSALKAHYRKCLQEAESTIGRRTIPSTTLERSIKLVTKWSRRQLGKRLTDEVLHQACTRIRSLHPNDTTPTQSQSSSPTPSPVPQRDYPSHHEESTERRGEVKERNREPEERPMTQSEGIDDRERRRRELEVKAANYENERERRRQELEMKAANCDRERRRRELEVKVQQLWREHEHRESAMDTRAHVEDHKAVTRRQWLT